MSKFNSNKWKIGKTLAMVLCGVLSVTAVAGAGASLYLGAKNNGWFDKTEEQPDDTTDETVSDNLVINQASNNGIKLLSETLTANSTATRTITAVYNSTASTPKFTWSSSDTSAITVTPSSDTLSCTVNCLGAFTSQVTITCTYAYDTSVSATCTVDYYKRLSSSSTGVCRFVNSTTTSYQYSNALDQSGETGIDSFTVTLPSYSSLSFYTTYYAYYGTGTLTETYTKSVSVHSYITDGDYDWSDYDENTRLANTAFCNQIFGYEGKSDAELNSIYSAWSTANATYDVKFVITLTGDSTGETSTVTSFVKFDMSNLIVSVTSLSINSTSIAF